MTVDVVTEIIIERPLGVVACFAADPPNAPEWYANIESVQWQTDPPVRLGSSMTFVARFLGRRLEYTYEVTELVPGERLVMATQQGPFPMETTYTWRPADTGGTRMVCASEANRHGSRSSPVRSWRQRCGAPTTRTS